MSRSCLDLALMEKIAKYNLVVGGQIIVHGHGIPKMKVKPNFKLVFPSEDNVRSARTTDITFIVGRFQSFQNY